MAEAQKLIGNSAFLFLDWIGITILSLIFWIVIGKTMPKDVYGIVATSLNIMIILSSISLLGFNTTLTKMISEFNAKNQEGKIKKLVALSIKIGLGMSIGFAAALSIFADWFSPILNLPVEVIYVTSAGIVIFAMWSLTTAIMYGFQTMKRFMATNFVGNAVKVVVTGGAAVIGLSYFGPLAGLILGVLTVVVLRMDTLILGWRRTVGSVVGTLDKRSVVSYSVSALAASIAMIGFSNMPNIILNSFTGPAVTSLFALSLTITSPILTIPSVLNAALFPITSGLSAKNNVGVRQKFLVNMVVKYALLVTLPLIVLLYVFSDTIILIFSTHEFLSAVELLPVVGAGAMLFGIGGIFNMTIYAIKKPDVSRNITIVTVAAFLILSVPLTQMYQAMGMAISYLVAVFIFFMASFLYLRSFMGLRIEMGPIFRIVVATLIFAGVLYLIDSFVGDRILKFAGTVMDVVIYVAVLAPLRFYKNEDLKILDTLSRKSPVGKGIFLRIRSYISRFVSA